MKGRIDKDEILKPIIDKIIYVYVELDFAVNRNKDDTEDIDTAISRHDFVIMYEMCPMIW